MNLYQISLALVVLFNFFLAIFVLSRNVKARVNRAFCLYSSFLTAWGTGMLALSLVPEGQKEIALWCVPILHLGLVFLPSSFFHFVLAITKDENKFNRRVCRLAYLFSVFFLISDRLGLFVLTSDVTFVFGSYRIVRGPSAPFFNLFFLFLGPYGTYLLYRASQAVTSPLEKNRYKYLFSGMVVSLFFAMTNIVRVMGVKVSPLGHIGILFLNFMTALAIVRYRLMDINIIIRPGLVYTTLTAFVTTLWLSGGFFFETLLDFQTLFARIMTIIIIVFLFNIIRERIQLMVDKIFYREKYELFHLQEKVTSEIAAGYDPDILVPSVLKEIEAALHPRFISAMLLSSDRRCYFARYLIGEGEKQAILPADDPLVKWLVREKREIFSEEPEENPEFNGFRKGVKEGFEKIMAKLVVPLIYGYELTGIFNLGKKKGEGYYTYNEIAFLNTIAKELALTLENTRLYADLKERTAELEKANAAKSDFLNVVSHELKTPLTVILSQVGLFKQEVFGKISEKQTESLKKIEDKGFKLRSLVADILNMSRLESGKVYDLKIKEVRIERIFEEIVESFKLLADNRGIKIEIDLSSEIPPILSDPGKIKNILSKLLDNAVKFTPSGGIIIIGAKEADKDVEFFVSDTGIGIREEDQKRIFERFFQVDASSTRKYGGTGLGLTVASELVKAMGGKIWVESRLREGSKFIFTIPTK
ncbi:MAG: ATP-binding protein [bacterium]|nr:ATP-binding protein [bacterium]